MNPFDLLPSLARRVARRGTAIATCAALAGLLSVAGCGGGGGDAGSGVLGTGDATATTYTQGTITGFGSIIVNGVRFDDRAAQVSDDDGSPHAVDALRLGMRVEIDSGRVDAATASARALAVRFGGLLTGPVEAVDAEAGTLTVLGQHIDVNATTVFDDSLAGGLAAVNTGAVLRVHGLHDAATGHIVATRLELEGNPTVYKLRGTVAALDTTAKTFRIGAAAISYAGVADTAVPSTLADGVTMRVTLAMTPLAEQWVALSLGQRQPRPVDRSEAHVRGAISAFTSVTRFSVDGLAVDASAARFPDGSVGLALGAQVEVQGSLSNGVLVANLVALESRHRGDEDRRLELHGAITAVDPAAKTFVLRNVTVSYAGNVIWERGAEANLAVGATVEVRGGMSGMGRTRHQVQALKIEFESSPGAPS